MPYYRRNLFILSATIFLASLSWNQIVPFLPKFLKELGVGDEALVQWSAIIFACQSLGSITTQPFWGKLGDMHGRKPMILRAGFCLAGVYFAMSFCHNPWQLAACRVLNGALTGFIPGSFALIATNTPQDEAPKSLATAQAASSVGLIVGPVAGTFLADAFGYRGSMQVAGTAVLISTLVVLWLVQEPNKTRPSEKTSLLQDFAISLKSPVQLSVMFAVMLAWVFGAAISPYLVLHLDALAKGLPSPVVGIVISLPAIAFVLVAHGWTRLGESKGYERGIVVGLVGGGLGVLSLALAHSIYAFAALYFVTGIWLAALSPSTAAITCTRVEESFRGRAYAIQQAAGTLGALLTPLVAAPIAKHFGIPAVFVFVSAIFLAGAVVFRALVGRWRNETC